MGPQAQTIALAVTAIPATWGFVAWQRRRGWASAGEYVIATLMTLAALYVVVHPAVVV